MPTLLRSSNLSTPNNQFLRVYVALSSQIRFGFPRGTKFLCVNADVRFPEPVTAFQRQLFRPPWELKIWTVIPTVNQGFRSPFERRTIFQCSNVENQVPELGIAVYGSSSRSPSGDYIPPTHIWIPGSQGERELQAITSMFGSQSALQRFTAECHVPLSKGELNFCAQRETPAPRACYSVLWVILCPPSINVLMQG
jgi:hypothetical protein